MDLPEFDAVKLINDTFPNEQVCLIVLMHACIPHEIAVAGRSGPVPGEAQRKDSVCCTKTTCVLEMARPT